MMKKPYFLLPLFLAGLVSCTSGDKEIPALVRASVEGMEIAKPALLDIFKHVEAYDVWDILDDTDESELLPEDIPGLIASLENLNEHLNAAAVKFEPFMASKEESIRTAALRTQETYLKLIKDNETSIGGLRSFVNDQAAAGVSGDDPGRLEKLQLTVYEAESDIGSFSSYLYHAASWVQEAMLKVYADKEKGRYPQAERERIFKRLEALYGAPREEMTMYEGIHFSNAVWALYEAIMVAEKRTSE